MDVIQSFLSQAVSYIVPLVILLGLLIFVHELGHFLVAKYFKVKVETFSLGFGKKLVKFQRGDTTYALSLIPFGGYVKMFGDDPNMEVAEEDKKVSFLHKPVGQRICIVLAGPIMNLLFAFVLFFTIAWIGDRLPAAQVGSVVRESVAAKAGFQPGDVIEKINDSVITSWNDVQEYLEHENLQTLQIQVKAAATGSSKTLQVTPELIDNNNVLSTKKKIYSIDGLELLPIASVVGVSNVESAAYKSGLRTGDRIDQVNETPVKNWTELEAAVAAGPIKKLQVSRLKEDKKTWDNKSVEVIFPVALNLETLSLAQYGIDLPDLYVGFIAPASPAEKAGLKVGDKILSVNGKELTYWQELTRTVKAYKAETGALNVEVIRDGAKVAITISPTMLTQENPVTGKKESDLKIGVGPVLMAAAPATVIVTHRGMSTSTVYAARETWRWIETTVLSFVRLVQNKVSTKAIGGPIMIGQIASETFKIGLAPFLKIMAIISINLFILNLLPIPVLDGGHLFFFTIEAIKGAPISIRKLEVAQQVGLFLLLFLMVFAMFNDLSRVFGF
jgi:regulator of sigma E protease